MKTTTSLEVVPSDLLWLQRAAELNGKSPLIAALLLLTLSRRFDRRQHIMVTAKTRTAHGLDQKTLYQALVNLETAGLVTVNRGRGRPPLVSIVDASCDDEVDPQPASEKE